MRLLFKLPYIKESRPGLLWPPWRQTGKQRPEATHPFLTMEKPPSGQYLGTQPCLCVSKWPSLNTSCTPASHSAGCKGEGKVGRVLGTERQVGGGIVFGTAWLGSPRKWRLSLAKTLRQEGIGVAEEGRRKANTTANTRLLLHPIPVFPGNRFKARKSQKLICSEFPKFIY